jgi:hypothetical protein
MSRKHFSWLFAGMVVIVLAVGMVGIALAQNTQNNQRLQNSSVETIESNHYHALGWSSVSSAV